VIRTVVISLSFVAALTGCRNSGGNDAGGNVPDNPIRPPTDTCPERQKQVLKDSNWDLDGSLEQVLDNLLQKKPTSEPVPVCT
jgi:hypothetical protein